MIILDIFYDSFIFRKSLSDPNFDLKCYIIVFEIFHNLILFNKTAQTQFILINYFLTNNKSSLLYSNNEFLIFQ